jgi:hypothetical protein
LSQFPEGIPRLLAAKGVDHLVLVFDVVEVSDESAQDTLRTFSADASLRSSICGSL